MLAILKDYIEVQEKKRKVEKWYCMMQAPHIVYVKLSWTRNTGHEGIFSPKEIYFFFLRKKFVAARYPNLKLFQNVFADHARDG